MMFGLGPAGWVLAGGCVFFGGVEGVWAMDVDAQAHTAALMAIHARNEVMVIVLIRGSRV